MNGVGRTVVTVVFKQSQRKTLTLSYSGDIEPKSGLKTLSTEAERGHREDTSVCVWCMHPQVLRVKAGLTLWLIFSLL